MHANIVAVFVVSFFPPILFRVVDFIAKHIYVKLHTRT